MNGEVMGYRIMQDENDNSVIVFRNDKPYIKASLTKPLTKFQMAGYWPMIRSRVDKVITLITDIDPDDITAFLEDINWLSGPLTHFEYVGAV